MSSKLKLSPKVSYMLGIYSMNKMAGQPISVSTRNGGVIEKFVKIAIGELGVEANKIMLNESGAAFYNSRLRKLFDRALERRRNTFKYLNDYSGNYVAGLFDCNGGMDRKGLFIRKIDVHDGLVLEDLGVHTRVQGSKSYIMNENALVALIKEHSLVLQKVLARGKRK
jgi:hypothetical protein